MKAKGQRRDHNSVARLFLSFSFASFPSEYLDAVFSTVNSAKMKTDFLLVISITSR